ncbi:hypothetical protein [Listeria booriae]|uniref:hypothetical protein n=1 Tax=Listeria booriae TaxID=1552123 RepID=UPI001627E169|nr:hypothetical protein [Listeria booriae]MBC2163424.1 hypothetical protein [Listeria booriae]
MYVGKQKNAVEINFMDSARFQSFTYQAEEDMGKEVDGKLTLVAGSIYPANDATAKGIVINDVDLSHGPQPVGVIVEGYIIKERLPETPTPEAIEAMKEIKFRTVTP